MSPCIDDMVIAASPGRLTSEDGREAHWWEGGLQSVSLDAPERRFGREREGVTLRAMGGPCHPMDRPNMMGPFCDAFHMGPSSQHGRCLQSLQHQIISWSYDNFRLPVNLSLVCAASMRELVATAVLRGTKGAEWPAVPRGDERDAALCSAMPHRTRINACCGLLTLPPIPHRSGQSSTGEGFSGDRWWR